VLMGANKGTADGDPVANQLVFLRDANGGLVQSAYTNSAGQYSFTNIPLGTYTVYPEEMNYTTTPSSSITITAGNSSVNGVTFKKDDVDMSFAPSTTGIDSRNARSINFIMVPNPTSGDVVLNFGADVKGKADVQITSLTGQVVYREVFNATKPASLNLSGLGSGMYFVTVSSDAGSRTEKLIIAK
jgi:hypothetical protein